jgi:hypothetical protein
MKSVNKLIRTSTFLEFWVFCQTVINGIKGGQKQLEKKMDV